MRRTVAVLSTICLLLSFAGCGKAQAPETPKEAVPSPGYYFDYETLPEEMVLSRVQMWTGDSLYLAGDGIQGNPVHGIYNNPEFSPFSLPEEVEHIYAACMKNQEIAVLAGGKPVPINLWLMNMESPQDATELCSLEILSYSNTGELLYRLPLTGQNVTQGAEFFSMEYLGDSFYLMSPNHFLQIGPDGSEINGFEIYSAILETNAPGQFVSMCRDGDRLYVCTYGDSCDPAYAEIGMYSGANLSVLNVEDFSLEQLHNSLETYPLGIGLDRTGDILLFDSEALYNLGQDGRTGSSILKWADIKRYSVPFSAIAAAGNERYILTSNEADLLFFLNCGEQVETRIELKLQCEQTSLILTALVERFNMLNDQYYITVEEVGSKAATRAEMIKGNLSDIYFFYGSDFLGGANKKNIFAELTPYMEKSGEISIVPSLQAAIEEEGKVYYLSLIHI